MKVSSRMRSVWAGGCAARPGATGTLANLYAGTPGGTQTLIEFDRELVVMFSARAKADGDPTEFQRYFILNGRFTAGTAIQYALSLITGTEQNQHLAMGFEIGTHFHSAPVIRLADAKPTQLGHVVKADGRRRLLLSAAEGETAPAGSLRPLCD